MHVSLVDTCVVEEIQQPGCPQCSCNCGPVAFINLFLMLQAARAVLLLVCWWPNNRQPIMQL
jgi:hypothetical protein